MLLDVSCFAWQDFLYACRVLKEERNYILQMIKKIRASGANVLLIQKSILRDAVTDLSLHYLVRLMLLTLWLMAYPASRTICSPPLAVL